MKKVRAIAAVLMVAAFSFMSCAQKPSIPKAGSARAADMLTLVPKSTAGIIVLDINRIMQTEAAKKTLEKSDANQKLLEFVKETGIDPLKDIYFVALNFPGEFAKFEEQGAAIVNVRYQKDKILAKIKEKVGNIQESDYSGVKILQVNNPSSGKPLYLAFLDDSNVVAGSEFGVKAAADVYLKKVPSLLDNKDMMSLVDTTNKAALVWGTFSITKDAAEKLAQNPMVGDLKGLKAINLSFDYKNKNIIAEIVLSGMDEAKNKQLADMLAGFKALGAAGAAKEPKLGELLNKIEISAASSYVKIAATIPESLIEEMSKKITLPKGIIQEKDELY